jgi:hypothetical protein
MQEQQEQQEHAELGTRRHLTTVEQASSGTTHDHMIPPYVHMPDEGCWPCTSSTSAAPALHRRGRAAGAASSHLPHDVSPSALEGTTRARQAGTSTTHRHTTPTLTAPQHTILCTAAPSSSMSFSPAAAPPAPAPPLLVCCPHEPPLLRLCSTTSCPHAPLMS